MCTPAVAPGAASWTQGSLSPCSSLNPQSQPCGCTQTPIHTHAQRQFLTQERGRKELNKKMGQTVLIRCRVWPDKRTDQQATCNQLFCTLIPLFSHTLIPLFPQALIPLSSAFVFSPNHPVINLLQSQNTFACIP